MGSKTKRMRRQALEQARAQIREEALLPAIDSRPDVPSPDLPPNVPWWPLIVDEKVYYLVEDFNALAKFEELTGSNGLELDDFADMSASEMRAYVWALTQRCHPDLTLEQVGAMMMGPIYLQVKEAAAGLAALMLDALAEAGGLDRRDVEAVVQAPLPGGGGDSFGPEDD